MSYCALHCYFLIISLVSFSFFFFLNNSTTTNFFFLSLRFVFFFFFNDTATTEIYTLSLHDALPIWEDFRYRGCSEVHLCWICRFVPAPADRKSTRLNSSHLVISYAVFCLKQKSTRLNSSHLVISYAVFCLKKKKKKNNSCHIALSTATSLSFHLYLFRFFFF